jgi:hypothetical protein
MSGTSTEAGGTKALTATWLTLLLFSLANYYLAEVLLSTEVLVAAILTAVLVKLFLVLAVFMELGHRGRAWLFPTTSVLAACLIVLGVLFFR